MQYRALICDLDMTVIDSRQDIAEAICQVIHEYNGMSVDSEAVTMQIGRSLWKIFEHLVPTAGSEKIDELVERYKKIFFDRCAIRTIPFPFVTQTLGRLGKKGIRRAIATTKMTFMAVRVCECLNLQHYFEHIQGTDGFPEKPDPTVLLKACTALSVDPQEAIVVGDTVMDIRAAKACGSMAVAVTYGIGKKDQLAAENPDRLIDSFSELSILFG